MAGVRRGLEITRIMTECEAILLLTFDKKVLVGMTKDTIMIGILQSGKEGINSRNC